MYISMPSLATDRMRAHRPSAPLFILAIAFLLLWIACAFAGPSTHVSINAAIDTKKLLSRTRLSMTMNHQQQHTEESPYLVVLNEFHHRISRIIADALRSRNPRLDGSSEGDISIKSTLTLHGLGQQNRAFRHQAIVSPLTESVTVRDLDTEDLDVFSKDATATTGFAYLEIGHDSLKNTGLSAEVVRRILKGALAESGIAHGIKDASGSYRALMKDVTWALEHKTELCAMPLADWQYNSDIPDSTALIEYYNENCLAHPLSQKIRKDYVDENKPVCLNRTELFTMEKEGVTRHLQSSGIDGRDQVIAFIDSGLDVRSPYFRDYGPDGCIPFSRDPKKSYPDCDHRKLKGYIKYIDGEEAERGHGTKVIGVAIGSIPVESSIFNYNVENVDECTDDPLPPPPDNAPTDSVCGPWGTINALNLAEYNGIAPAAKGLIIDVGCNTEGGCTCAETGLKPGCVCDSYENARCPKSDSALYIPSDQSELLDMARGGGASIVVNPWESTATLQESATGAALGYDNTNAATDAYLWQARDLLVIVPAGNKGASGSMMTLSREAQSKNVLTVGSSFGSITDIARSALKLQGLAESASNVSQQIYDALGCDSIKDASAGSDTYAVMRGPIIATPALCDLLQSDMTNEEDCCKEVGALCSWTDNQYDVRSMKNMHPFIKIAEETNTADFITNNQARPKGCGCAFADIGSRCCKKCVVDNMLYRQSMITPDWQSILSVPAFSSRGPTVDGRVKPDIVAPGFVVPGPFAKAPSATDKNSDAFGPTAECPIGDDKTHLENGNADYTSDGSGSSISAGIAGGLAALVRQYLTQGFYPTGYRVPGNAIARPSSALLKAMIMHSGEAPRFITLNSGSHGLVTQIIHGSEDPDSQGSANPFYKSILGYVAGAGIPFLRNTLKLVHGNNVPVVTNGTSDHEEDAGFSDFDLVIGRRSKQNGESRYITNDALTGDPVITKENVVHGYSIRVLGTGQPIRMTLVWTDPVTPAMLNATSDTEKGRVLVNNLDLLAVRRGFTDRFYYGSAMRHTNVVHDTAAAATDNDNNFEFITLSKDSLDIGDVYYINVKASTLAIDNQPYALVITGQVELLPESSNPRDPVNPEIDLDITEMAAVQRATMVIKGLEEDISEKDAEYKAEKHMSKVLRGVSIALGATLGLSVIIFVYEMITGGAKLL